MAADETETSSNDSPPLAEPDAVRHEGERSRLRLDEPLRDELGEQFNRARLVLTGNPDDAAERALERYRGDSRIEERIRLQMADPTPLAHPDAFPAAHRAVVHALEVLDREGSRNPEVPPLGPFAFVAEYFVETSAQYIVQSYAQGVIGTMRRLYARREVKCERQSQDRVLLTRARIEMDRLAVGFTGGGLGAPALLAGGLAVPLLASAFRYAGALKLSNNVVLFSVTFLVFIVTFALSAALLRGAAVAHRRSKLIMEAPLRALWASLGNAGSPPTDDSDTFASIAIIMTAVAWIALPATAAAIYFSR